MTFPYIINHRKLQEMNYVVIIKISCYIDIVMFVLRTIQTKDKGPGIGVMGTKSRKKQIIDNPSSNIDTLTFTNKMLAKILVVKCIPQMSATCFVSVYVQYLLKGVHCFTTLLFSCGHTIGRLLSEASIESFEHS